MKEWSIATDGLSKRFGRKQALDEFSIRLPSGGIHALVGSNGAGKSTLFRLLLGLLSPSRGRSWVLGVDSELLDPATRGRIGLVHEEHTLPSWMTVAGVTAMHRSQYADWHEPTYREVVGHFHVLPEQKIAQLSRGERAGLNLAMALAQQPELLILDEPTLGLDVVAKQAFLESLLFTGEQQHCTVVYCSHQMDEVERVADNLIILERGTLVSMSAPDVFCDRISAWMVDFEEASPPRSAIPGLLQTRDIDGRRQLVVIDQGDAFDSLLVGLGGRDVQRLPLGLGGAVNAYLTRNHDTPEVR